MHNWHESHSLTIIWVDLHVVEMAENGNGMGGGDARPSTANPTNDVELKNLLIDLVKEQPLIYDKSHRDTSEQIWGPRYSMILEIFWAFLVSTLNLCCSVYSALSCIQLME